MIIKNAIISMRQQKRDDGTTFPVFAITVNGQTISCKVNPSPFDAREKGAIGVFDFDSSAFSLSHKKNKKGEYYPFGYLDGSKLVKGDDSIIAQRNAEKIAKFFDIKNDDSNSNNNPEKE